MNPIWDFKFRLWTLHLFSGNCHFLKQYSLNLLQMHLLLQFTQARIRATFNCWQDISHTTVDIRLNCKDFWLLLFDPQWPQHTVWETLTWNIRNKRVICAAAGFFLQFIEQHCSHEVHHLNYKENIIHNYNPLESQIFLGLLWTNLNSQTVLLFEEFCTNLWCLISRKQLPSVPMLAQIRSCLAGKQEILWPSEKY